MFLLKIRKNIWIYTKNKKQSLARNDIYGLRHPAKIVL